MRPGLPPIISIQGDADPTVPYSHSVRLQDALKKAGVDGELITIPGGKHGGFTRAENQRAHAAIRAFPGQARVDRLDAVELRGSNKTAPD